MSAPRIEDLRVFNVVVTWRTEVQVIALDADAALLACPACRREWRACACVDAPDALDVAAGYASDPREARR